MDPGETLIQYDWYPYKKRRLVHRQIQREDHMKAKGESGHLQGERPQKKQPF